MNNPLIPGRPYSHVYKARHLKAIQQLTDANNIETERYRISTKEHIAREEYRKFIDQLPKFKGTIILYGKDNQNKEIILKVFEGTANLKEEFKSPLQTNGCTISRRDWIHNKFKNHNLKYVFICPAHKMNVDEPE
ncbi:MAG: hypothetical protein ACKOW8_05940 [Flavobacteriales bacterium]